MGHGPEVQTARSIIPAVADSLRRTLSVMEVHYSQVMSPSSPIRGLGEAGSVFSQVAVPIAGFDTTFTFQMVAGTVPMADGITFTIQGAGNSALGMAATAWDTMASRRAWRSSLTFSIRSPGRHVSQTGLYTNGADPQQPSIDLLPSGIDLTSQHPFKVQMHYDGTTLNVTITDTVTQVSASQSYTIDIPHVIGSSKGFVGFTAGTGGLSAVQRHYELEVSESAELRFLPRDGPWQCSAGNLDQTPASPVGRVPQRS